jgi:hypothetical protein
MVLWDIPFLKKVVGLKRRCKISVGSYTFRFVLAGVIGHAEILILSIFSAYTRPYAKRP